MGWDKLREQRHARLKASGLIDSNWPLAQRPETLPAWDSITAERKDQWDQWMAVYAAQVEEMDTAIGRIVSFLRDTGQEENTLILFFSDNGGAAERPVKTMDGAEFGSRESYEGYGLPGAHVSSAPFRKTKKYAHEGGIASPLIVYWPRGVDPSLHGKLSREPGHVIDIMATCLDLAGARAPRQWNAQKTTPLEGVSLAPTFHGKKVKRAQPIFWEHEGHRAVRDGKWKIVSTFGEPWELYDLEADRTELNNLAETQASLVKRLSAKYDAWARRAGVLPWTNLPPPK
jgi:arylsulfatase A-like enzyme